jgi:hypothetical protein
MAPIGGTVGGQIFMTPVGDEAPMTAPGGPQVGYAMGCIDPAEWSLHDEVGTPLAHPIETCALSPAVQR